METDQEKLKEILAEAIARTEPSARAAYLDGACGCDAVLRSKVEGLIAAYEKQGDFVERTLAVPGLVQEGPGTMIGRYKLLQEIGEGAFGVVYVAEQTEPVHRMVALKIIKAGMDTRAVIARFEAEEQALALMDHPNIAQVLDAGTTETGRPYFVMELVKGLPITTYADEYNLSTEERLQLFMQVCHGVQHAHQKGIIHRDLKPTNILVTVIDGEPVPKIIDFGVAKALGQKLTDKTLFTAFDQIIGTPAYMSPEQAELSGVDIDTRADIYALGVLLYELLTGVTPFDQETLRQAALDEVRRMIRETEPPKPSTRLHALGERLTEVAKHRQTEPAILNRLVRGDLDWIVMKCLEKDRRRRYETAGSLAEDLQRHRGHQPVQASPPSTAYRARKFIRRHRTGVAMAAGMAVMLLAATLISSSQAVRATRAERAEKKQRRQAELDRTKAETEASKSRQVAQFLNDMLQSIGPSIALGRDTTLLREILDRTADRVGKELANQPEVELEVRTILCGAYLNMGNLSHSNRLESARAIVRLTQSLPVAANVRAEALLRLAITLSTSRLDEAERYAREALAAYRKIGGKDPGLTSSLAVLSGIQCRRGKYAAAEKLLREAIAIDVERFGTDHKSTAAKIHRLAQVLRDRGRLDEAETSAREALAIRRRIVQSGNRDGAKSMRDVVKSILLLAWILQDQKKWADTETLLREELAPRRDRLHPDVILMQGQLARALQNRGRLAEAEVVAREALASARQTWAKTGNLWDAVERLAEVLRLQKKYGEAESLYREVLARNRHGVATDDSLRQRRRYKPELGFAGLVDCLRAQNKLAALEQLYREELAILRKLLGNQHRHVVATLGELALVLQDQGKAAEAGKVCQAMMDIMLKLDMPGLGGNELTQLPTLLKQAGRILKAQGCQLDECETLFQEVINTARLKLGETNRVLGQVLHVYGDFLLWQAGKPALAVEAYLKSLPIRRVNQDVALAYTLRNLGVALADSGKPKEAEAYFRESLALYRRLHKGDQLYLTAYNAVSLGAVLRQQNRLPEAEAAYREAVTSFDKLGAGSQAGWAREQLLEVLRRLGKLDEMEKVCRELAAGNNAGALNRLAWRFATLPDPNQRDGQWAVKLAKRAVAATGRTNAMYLDTLAAAYAEAGQFTNAVGVQQEAIALLTNPSRKEGFVARLRLYESGLPFHEPALLAQRISALLAAGKVAEAEPVARECLVLREILIPDNWLAFNACSMLGGSLLGQKKYAEAEPLLLSGYEGMKCREHRIPAAGKPRLREALERLVRLNEALAAASPGSAEYRQDFVAAYQQLLNLETNSLPLANQDCSRALAFVDQAIARARSNGGIDEAAWWNTKGRLLKRLGQSEEALRAMTKAVELASANTNGHALTPAEAHLSRSRLLQQMNRLAEAAADVRQALDIPQRGSPGGTNLVDLSSFYNAGLKPSWHGGDPDNDLAALPTGIQNLGGTEFDIRGLVQVSRWLPAYPVLVTNIPLGRLCQRIHFLHAACYADHVPDGTQTGSYVVHYVNGQQRVIPLVIGQDLADWWQQPNEQGKPFVVAWTGSNRLSASLNRRIRLFKTTWPNPQPDLTIQSIDFEAVDNKGSPFLVAITVE